MPYANIKVTREDGAPTIKQKEELIKGATKLISDVLGRNPSTTFVIIDELDTDNWGIGGESITTKREMENLE